VKQVKDLLVQAIVWDTKGTTTPVIHVGINNYFIGTTSTDLYKWRTRLCAGKKEKKPAPLHASCF
jgi:hypothetical protein